MKALTVIGLAISVTALVISIWTLTIVNNETEARFDAAVDRALARREKQIISQLWPRLKTVYSEMGLPDAPQEQPQTIEELFGPLFDLMKTIGG